MDEQTLSLLYDEIQNEFEELKNLEVGSDKHRTAIDGLTKLVDRKIEIEKSIIDNENKVEIQKKELELKEKAMKDERVDKYVKNGLTAASIVGGLGVTVWGTIKSIKFEETGTITTIMGRGFIQSIQKLIPKK